MSKSVCEFYLNSYSQLHLDGENYMHFLILASQGSLATDSAVLKLSGKVFDKPFKGPVSLHTMQGRTQRPPVLSVSACSQAIVFDGVGPAYDAIMGG